MTYVRYSWPLCSEGLLTCHIHCDTGLPFIMVISEDLWHSYLLSSVLQWSCHYLFFRLRSVSTGDRIPISRMRGERSTSVKVNDLCSNEGSCLFARAYNCEMVKTWVIFSITTKPISTNFFNYVLLNDIIRLQGIRNILKLQMRLIKLFFKITAPIATNHDTKQSLMKRPETYCVHSFR